MYFGLFNRRNACESIFQMKNQTIQFFSYLKIQSLYVHLSGFYLSRNRLWFFFFSSFNRNTLWDGTEKKMTTTTTTIIAIIVIMQKSVIIQIECGRPRSAGPGVVIHISSNRIEIKSNIERWLLTIITQCEIHWALEKHANKSVARNRWCTPLKERQIAVARLLSSIHNTMNITEYDNYSKMTKHSQQKNDHESLSLKILFSRCYNYIIHSGFFCCFLLCFTRKLNLNTKASIFQQFHWKLN